MTSRLLVWVLLAVTGTFVVWAGLSCQANSSDDAGVIICKTIKDCPFDYFCDDGFCRLQEAESGGTDEGFDGEALDGGEGIVRDYSRFAFTLAVARDKNSGVATQCVAGVHPEPNQGPVLPTQTLANGFMLSGTVRDNVDSPVGGASVSLIGDLAVCLPKTVTTDMQGRYSFYLPAGDYALQAAYSISPLALAKVVYFNSNAEKDLVIPVAATVGGGPLEDPSRIQLNDWLIQAIYRGGEFKGRLAHLGVENGPPAFGNGLFEVSLPVGEAYDLIGLPPPATPYPIQMLYSDIAVGSQGVTLFAHSVRDGAALQGKITWDGTGAAGSSIELVYPTDQKFNTAVTASVDGNYQLVVRPPTGGDWLWQFVVTPTIGAFNQGATQTIIPNLGIKISDPPQIQDVELAPGEAVVFEGRLIDPQGNGVVDALVRLIAVPESQELGATSFCDPNAVSTQNDGTFRVTCNLILPPSTGPEE